MKKAPILPLLLQIWVLTLVILGGLQLWNTYKNPTSSDVSAAVATNNIKTSSNAEVFSSAYASSFGTIWVALSTRIGTNFTDTSSQSTTWWSYYKEISFIWDTPEERTAIRANMIEQNMIIIREYLNLSRTDIKNLLSGSNNRRSTLEGFISQLELRFINSAKSIENLEKQKALILARIVQIEAAIEVTKASMEKNFSESIPDSTLKDVETYFMLRERYTESFTDIVFINQFIKQHTFLNNYNKWILDTLINNKEAIINESYVVIPDSGDQYLRPLELLFEEADFKANIQERE